MKVQCNVCCGDGEVDRECPHCKGKGWAHGDECGSCGGDGHSSEDCVRCSGTGSEEVSIEAIKLTRDTEHYKELLPLQGDAIRARKHAEALSQLRPGRAESYQAQLSATLAEINRQAEEIVTPKKKGTK